MRSRLGAALALPFPLLSCIACSQDPDPYALGLRLGEKRNPKKSSSMGGASPGDNELQEALAPLRVLSMPPRIRPCYYPSVRRHRCPLVHHHSTRHCHPLHSAYAAPTTTPLHVRRAPQHRRPPRDAPLARQTRAAGHQPTGTRPSHRHLESERPARLFGGSLRWRTGGEVEKRRERGW